MKTKTETRLKDVRPADRVLLLPHCLRRTETCKAKYDELGLNCQGCTPDCPINILRQAAIEQGYMGVCVAPGGSLALKYIKDRSPSAIVAVACEKELKEGIQGVGEMDLNRAKKIPIVVIPLTREGCVNTEVDIDLAIEKITQ